MRTRSVKRAKQEREYKKNRRIYLELTPVCERCLSATSTDVHHRKGRMGDLLVDATYFLAVCRECHKWIEENPIEAKNAGFSLSRLAKEVSELKKV